MILSKIWVGRSVVSLGSGAFLSLDVGSSVGIFVDLNVGSIVGSNVGSMVGSDVGSNVGFVVEEFMIWALVNAMNEIQTKPKQEDILLC